MVFTGQDRDDTLRHTFATYGIPDKLSSDGGPVFMAQATRQFLHQWGIHYRLSSVAFPHSNCRAEVGIKTIKRLITGNVGKDGAINVDAFQEAILQYRNTPDPTTKMSPAMCVFGRPTKDLNQSLGSVFASFCYRPVGVSVDDDKIGVALVVEIVGTYALERVLREGGRGGW